MTPSLPLILGTMSAAPALDLKVPIKWEPQPKPFLDEFTLFSQLPTELRQEIWKFTLESRAVEVLFMEFRGFYSRAKTPVALRTNRDSRHAVLKLYPSCFGNIIYKPNIVFNFSLDTLYFDHRLERQLVHFLVGMAQHERKRIQSIAIAIDKANDWPKPAALNYLQASFRHMPALEEVKTAYRVSHPGHREGLGPIRLSAELPCRLYEFFERSGSCTWNGEQSAIHELPDESDSLLAFNVPRQSAVWCWQTEVEPGQVKDIVCPGQEVSALSTYTRRTQKSFRR